MSMLTTRVLMIAGLAAFGCVALGDDADKSRRAGCDARDARVVVRDLRGYGAYGRTPYRYYYGSRSPDEVRRLIEERYRARRHIAALERQRIFNEKDMAERRERLLSQHERTLKSGLRLLQAGETERAVIALTMAAKLNQGDPACRIHLAQARLELGHYREAGLVLRRALQLQPKLVYADLHLDRNYGREGVLASCTDKLGEWIKENPNAPPETHFLLGFLEVQRGDFAAAHESFLRAKRALPDDDLTLSYLDITKPPAVQVDGD